MTQKVVLKDVEFLSATATELHIKVNGREVTLLRSQVTGMEFDLKSGLATVHTNEYMASQVGLL